MFTPTEKRRGNATRALMSVETRLERVAAMGVPVRPDQKDAILRAVIALPVTEADAVSKVAQEASA